MVTSGRRVLKNHVLAKRIASIALSIGLTAGSLVALNSVASASATFTVPAGGLDFTNSVTIGNVTQGTIRTYENVDGNGTVAKVEILSLTNSRSIVDEDWTVDWTAFTTQVADEADPGEFYASATSFRVSYEFYLEAIVVVANVSLDVSRITVTTSRQLEDLSDVTFYIEALDSSEEMIGTLVLDVYDDGEFQRGNPGPALNAATYYPGENRLHYLDDKDSDSTVIDGFLRTSLYAAGSGDVNSRVKVSFEDSSGNPRTFTNLRVNSYDVDAEQYVQFENVTSESITRGSNIDTVTEISSGVWKVTAKSSTTTVVGEGNAAFSDPLSTAYSTGKVSVSYGPVSEVIIGFGFTSEYVYEGASYEFDFGDRVAAAVASSQPVGLGSIPTSTPQVVAVDVSPTSITTDNQIITVAGINLDRVDSVLIGGVSVPIISKSRSRIQVRAPLGLSGLVDLELRSSLNNVLMTKKLNFGGAGLASTRKATLIVGGFAHNSRVLTPRMKARIDRWLTKNSDLSTLTCTGFTSLPRRTTDVRLSTNRGVTACNFSKAERAELVTSVSRGIEDPRPGLNIRRVMLELTP